MQYEQTYEDEYNEELCSMNRIMNMNIMKDYVV